MNFKDPAEVSGIICVDKPKDYTSFDVVARMRGICRTKKIGHAGTLDPMATGVLPLFLGRATKACAILPDQNKRYQASFRLGITTDTQDITGKILQERPVQVSCEQVQQALQSFVGDILQLPPMYSAIQVGGQRLYDLARQGIEVERQPREVSILSIDLLQADEAAGEYTIDVLCAKGTYIRTLCHDVGEKLGCGATLTSLRRTMAAGFCQEDCITLEQAEEFLAAGTLFDYVLPVEKAFAPLYRIQLSEKQAKMYCNGVKLDPKKTRCSHVEGNIAVYGPNDTFLGVSQVDKETGLLETKSLFYLANW